MKRHQTASLLSCIALASSFLLAGCGDNSPSANTSTPTASADKSIADEVPAAIRDKGTITVAMEAQYPPFEYFDTDNKTIIGFDAELANALAQAMGLNVTLMNAGFDTIIPGLSGGKYDLGISSFTDTEEREQVVDFVTYFSEGNILMTKAGNPDGLDINDLCGKIVGVGKGGTQSTVLLPKLSAACEGAGKSAIVVKVFSGQDAPNLALASGQIQATILDQVAAVQIAEKSNGKFEVVGDAIDSAPIGIAVPKKSGFTDAVHAAMQSLIDDGTYDELLAKWGLEKGAVTSSEVNVAKS